jgi:hypothetical protein
MPASAAATMADDIPRLTVGNLYTLEYVIGPGYQHQWGCTARVQSVVADGADIVYLLDTPSCTFPVLHRWIRRARDMGPDYGDYKGTPT